MIDAKQAVKIASEHLVEVLGRDLAKNVLVQEFELDEKSAHWLVTIGFEIPELRDQSSLGFIASERPDRQFKCMHVDAERGIVTAMKTSKL